MKKRREVFTVNKKDGWCLISSYKHDKDGRIYQGYINVSGILDHCDEVVLVRAANSKAGRGDK